MSPTPRSVELDAIDAVIDAYGGEDLEQVAPARIDAEVVALDRTITRLEAERLRRLGAWQVQGVWAHDGSKSAAAALARRCSMAAGTARDRLRLAQRLRQAPLVSAAFGAGTLTLAKVRLLTALLGDDQSEIVKDAFHLAERDLVDVAGKVSVRDLAYVVRHFAAHADPDGHDKEWDEHYEANRLDVAESFEGCGHLKGFLDPESTQIVRHALGVLEDRLYRDGDDASDDARPRLTPAQRRAESLVALCQSVLDDDPARDANLAGVARPVVTATIDYDRYHDILSSDATMTTLDASAADEQPLATLAANHQPLPRKVSQRLLCDAVIVRVLTKGGAAPLEVGRASRGPTAALLRALLLRDGGCAFPGCETSPRFCHAHHVHHWQDGGLTELGNLVLLCRHHHRLLHHSRWRCRIDRDDGLPRFTDPDGRERTADPTPLHHARAGRDLARRHRAA